MTSYSSQQNHRIEIKQKFNSLSASLKLMSSRMSPRACRLVHVAPCISSSPSYAINTPFWQVPPAVLTAGFSYISTKRQQNVSFRNQQMSLNGKHAGELARMASIWRQNGVLMAYFRTCALKKSDKFSRELDLWLICILWQN